MSETPRHGHGPIQMRRLDEAAFHDRDDMSPGDFYWSEHEGVRHIGLVLPSPRVRKFDFVLLPVREPGATGKGWEWDRNEQAPSLYPSIHTHGVWHGFVKRGTLIEA